MRHAETSGARGETTLTRNEEHRAVREAVGVFDTTNSLQTAIDELLSSGFDRADISLLAAEQTVEEKLSQWSRRTEVADDPSTPRAVYVSPEAIGAAEGGLISGLMYLGAVATAGLIAVSGGPIIAIVAGAALAGGVGGLLGGALAKLVGDHRAAYFHRQLEQGGLLLWVRIWDVQDESRAVEILMKHGAHDVHVHEFSDTGAPTTPAISALKPPSDGKGLTN